MQNFFFLIAPILFLCYEESVCPLILKYNKVYFVSPLIAKPNICAAKVVYNWYGNPPWFFFPCTAFTPFKMLHYPKVFELIMYALLVGNITL